MAVTLLPSEKFEGLAHQPDYVPELAVLVQTDRPHYADFGPPTAGHVQRATTLILSEDAD